MKFPSLRYKRTVEQDDQVYRVYCHEVYECVKEEVCRIGLGCSRVTYFTLIRLDYKLPGYSN